MVAVAGELEGPNWLRRPLFVSVAVGLRARQGLYIL